MFFLFHSIYVFLVLFYLSTFLLFQSTTEQHTVHSDLLSVPAVSLLYLLHLVYFLFVLLHTTLELSVSSHLAYDAVLHVCLLVAALFAHQCDLQLTERFRQDVALGEELSPLNNVGLQQSCVVLVAQHPLPWQKIQVKVRSTNKHSPLIPSSLQQLLFKTMVLKLLYVVTIKNSLPSSICLLKSQVFSLMHIKHVHVQLPSYKHKE